MTVVPALMALLVSMIFTLFAVHHPQAATIMAAPIAMLAIGLIMLSKRWPR